MKRKGFLKLCIAALFISILPGLYGAEKSRLRFTHITEARGLTSAYISSIYQDKHGFIWIGSYHSTLCRYDGIQMKVYRHDPTDPSSLPAAQYRQILMDDENILWIGTTNGLVALDLNTEKVTHYTHDPEDPSGIPFGYITHIYEDSGDHLWMTTFMDGLVVFDKKTGKFRHYRHDEEDPHSLCNNSVFALAASSNGDLWVGTYAGLDKFDPETGQFFHYRNDPDNPRSLSNNVVLSLVEDREGTLWVATAEGLNALDPGGNHFRRYSCQFSDAEYQFSLNLIYEGPVSGKLWASIAGIGLFEFDREKEEFIFVSSPDPMDPYSIGTTDINAILEDKSGMLWIGGSGGYLNVTGLKEKGFHYLKNDPQDPEGFHGKMARAFAQDETGLIWVATVGGGLQVFDREKGKIIKRYTHDKEDPGSILSNDARSVLLDNTGVIWVGTYDGISRLDRTTGRFTNYPGQAVGITEMLQDRRGTIWAAGWNGLYSYNREPDRFEPLSYNPIQPESMKAVPLFDVYEDNSGNIFAGTQGSGVFKFNPETDDYSFITHDPADPGSLSHNGVFAVFEDSRKDLWVATIMGLNRYDKEKGEFIHYSKSDGLGSDTVYELLEDDYGNLWIITNVGLTRYDPVKNTFHNYDTSDGILGKDHFGKPFRSKDGFIYFSGNGINYFDPAKITENHYIPPVVITGMQLFNQEVPLGGFENGRSILTKSMCETSEIELLYRDYIISFEFSALNFVNSHKNQYAYIMEGFEEEWNYSGTRNFVTYTNLGAGNYTFRVKAANNDGKWNEEGVSLLIKVLPPYWQTWWFKTAISVIVIIILGVIFMYFLMRMKTKHKALLIKQEVDIARKIQTSLLPDLDEFTDTGYDFEASMNVAASVGGDYYDILRDKNDRLWLGIGDVTGHGIPAGLIMVMAQVGIHNLLETIPGITPEELLTRINKIMTNNIRCKMKSDQHMTINFLVENKPGHFHYAGAHEIILIHRARTGEVVQVETNGFWLGIIDDCEEQMNRGKGSFQLEKKDTLLLYTDGLIQIMNKDHEQFDLQRLIKIMRHNSENPQTLKKAIDNAIKEFGGIQKDDITYLICRRN
ncbi:MAG: SpoIIE family protein phosphatase [Spirochaetales bacterium]|nr:SpoIIE family protein phosphatase [Spirochaetales bacterium]